MTFPLRVGTKPIEDPPALARAFAEDALAKGALIPGQRASQWALNLVARGTIDTDFGVGLAAALLRRSEGPVVLEAARFAAGLGRPELSPVLRLALGALDVAVLLAPDDLTGAPTEEVLLRCWARVADARDPVQRAELLECARNAGLPDVEIEVLLSFADEAELRALLPGVLAEALPDGLPALLIRALDRAEVRAALVEVYRELKEPLRAAVFAAAAGDPVARRWLR